MAHAVMVSSARDHVVLQPLHAAVWLHRRALEEAALRQNKQPGSAEQLLQAELEGTRGNTDETLESNESSSPSSAAAHLTCARCVALSAAAAQCAEVSGTSAVAVDCDSAALNGSVAPSPSSNTTFRLYSSSLAHLAPFATLSPNLSQLAFTLPDAQRQTPGHSPLAGTDAGIDTQHWRTFIDEESGFLRWDAFSSARIDEWNSTRPAAPDASSNAYSAASAFLTAACAAVHPFVSAMAPQEFENRYGRYLPMSNHASMGVPLYEKFHSGCHTPSADGALTATAVFLVLSTHIERLLGDIFCARRSSPSAVCPRMLRDLFLSREVSSFLPPECLFLLQALCGSPKSFNIRNILYHGFMCLTCEYTHDVVRPFTSMLWLVFVGLLRECDKIWRPTLAPAPPTEEAKDDQHQQVDGASKPLPFAPESGSLAPVASSTPPPPKLPFRRPLKSKFPGDAALHAHLSSDFFCTAATTGQETLSSFAPFSEWALAPALVYDSFPIEFASISAEVGSLLSSSYILPHHRVHDLMAAFQLLRTNRFLAVSIMMPTIEQVMRNAFVYANATIPASSDSTSSADSPHEFNPRIDAGLLLAQSEKLFTTLDIVLGEQVPPIDDEAEADEELAAASPPTPVQKCDRTSAFAFPLVAAPCDFEPTATFRNQLFATVHASMPALPGSGVLYALYDLALCRLGPRIRDRVAHGEILWHDDSTLPAWLALWCFNVVVGLAVRFPLHRPTEDAGVLLPPPIFTSDLARRARDCFDRYAPITHPRAQFMQRMAECAQAVREIERRVVQATQVNEDEAPTEESCDESLSMPISAPSLQWYRFSLAHTMDVVETRGVQVLTASSVGDFTVISNALAVRCGLLLRQMRASEPDMPLWPQLSAWITDPQAVTTLDNAPIPSPWWTLATDPFWRRSHLAFHHSSDSAQPPSACSLACELQCFDHSMTHAPIICIQRILDTLLQLPSSICAAYDALRQLATGPDAPSAKRKLILQVSASLPSILLCCTVTLAAVMILWEQMMRKAHTHAAETTASSVVAENTALALAPPSSPVSGASSLLRLDRSISRLLKKVSSGLDRIRMQYGKNRWLFAADEWRTVIDAVAVWRRNTDEFEGDGEPTTIAKEMEQQ